MGRGTKGGGGKKSSSESWNHNEHQARLQSKIDNLQKRTRPADADAEPEEDKETYKRTKFAHDNRVKIDGVKLKLNITVTRRHLEKLRSRLEQWDEVEEVRLAEVELKKEVVRQQKLAELELNGGVKKRKKRPGPETWQLRGAARPAWLVNEMDVRYVCPHLKAHADYNEKQSRIQNVVALYRGKFGMVREGEEDGPPQPHCRDMLSCLVRLGHLNLEAKRFKSARQAFLECIELEVEHPVTNARSQLVRMYLDQDRPDSARKLCENFAQDKSAWIRFSAALIEYVSWKLLKEEGSTKQTAEAVLVKAIKANMYCAFYLAFHQCFEEVMEYTEEIEDAQEGSLEEAIEYCNSEQMGIWIGTDGSLDWIQNVLIRLLHRTNIVAPSEGALTKDDLDWNQKLIADTDRFFIEKNDHEKVDDDEDEEDDDKEGDEEEEEKEIDFTMYAGMFRTGMEMLEDDGLLKCEIDDDDEEDSDQSEDEKSANDSEDDKESS